MGIEQLMWSQPARPCGEAEGAETAQSCSAGKRPLPVRRAAGTLGRCRRSFIPAAFPSLSSTPPQSS